MSAHFGGAAARDSVPVSFGGSFVPALAGRSSSSLGSLGGVVSPSSAWLYHLLTVFAVGAGGALTGYLAGGSKKGAFIGAATHLALFGGTVAAVGTQFSTAVRAVYGTAALGSSVGIGYLLWKRR